VPKLAFGLPAPATFQHHMNKKSIEEIQNKVIDLLTGLSSNLHVAAKDQCSEVTRLVACWLLSEHPEYSTHIFKGEFSNTSAHDILGVVSGDSVFVLDPTVWQIFPKSESILVGIAPNVSIALNLLKEKYGGAWQVSETIEQCSDSYKQKLLTIIKQNVTHY
jgi:midasin (ATPase involved in ribosome maturation)